MQARIQQEDGIAGAVHHIHQTIYGKHLPAGFLPVRMGHFTFCLISSCPPTHTRAQLAS